MFQHYDIMVIAPHPDDPEFGAGGTVAKWTAKGRTTIYIICTNGNKGTEDPDMTPEKLSAIRKEEQKEAARILGVSQVIFLEYDDQTLEDTADFRKEIVRYIRMHTPYIIIAPDPYRRYIWHRDHRITGQVVLDAVFPYARDRLAYPEFITAGLQPHKVKEVLLFGSESPNYYVDVHATFQLKISALYCHKSQVAKFQPDWEENYKKMLAKLGESCNYELAEAFYRVILPP